MSTPPLDAKARIPGWLKALVILIVLALLAVAVLSLLTRASTARWQRYATTLRAKGQPLTFDEIEAFRTQIPDERNGAQVIQDLLTRLGGIGESPWEARAVFVFGRDPHDLDFFEGSPRYRIEPSRAFIEEHQDLLDALSALRDKPNGRFDLDLDANPFHLALPELSPLRTAAKLVRLDGALKLIDGDIAGAAEAVPVIFHIGATLDEHPTVIGRLVQISVDALATNAIENILRAGSVDGRTLLAITDVVSSRLDATTMRWAFLGERAFFIGWCDGLADGSLSLAETSTEFATPGPNWLPEMLIRENQMRGVEMYTWLVDAADDPAALTKAAARIDKEVPNLPMQHVLLKMMLPSLSRMVTLHLRITAKLESTRAALAAERFRLATGSLPDSLDDLVPEFLDAVPPDPFDGEPLRLALADKGIVIYSVGDNLEDDGGIVARQEQRPYLPDVGFRLFKPEHRGLVLTDEPPPDDD